MIKPGTMFTPIIGDFALTTHSPWCHINQSQTPLSKRIAASAFKDQSHKFASRITKLKRCTNDNLKCYEQVHFLKEVQVCNIASNNNVQYLTPDNIKDIIVCDRVIQLMMPYTIHSDLQVLHLRNGDLWIADTGNATLGLCFTFPSDKMPVFIQLPRNESQGIMNDGRKVCSATRSYSLTRGNQTMYSLRIIINTAVLVHSQEELKRVCYLVSTG
jgi:hypothetical protein